MSRLTRRGFLGASIGAAGGVAAATAVPGGAQLAALAAKPGEADLADNDAVPVVAVVRDASRGEVSVMMGEHEVTYRDPELVQRLVRRIV